MFGANLPVGCFIHIEKPHLQAILDQLRAQGFRVIGPTVADGAIVFQEIDTVSEMPIGYFDQQEPASYRIERNTEGAYFDYVVGPHSLKNDLFPPRVSLVELRKNGDGWITQLPEPPARPLAVIGARPCDLHALKRQDRIFLADRYPNPDYEARRNNLFIVAVNCGRPASTCFCTSMETGPAASEGFDLAITELPTHFVIEIGTDRGGKVASAAPWTPCSNRDVSDAQQVTRRAEREMEQRRFNRGGEPPGRFLDTNGIHDLLLDNLEHDEWDKVADRCLACGNCTLVCPTCFCSTVEEVSDLSGSHVRRDRFWESCFTSEHSYMNSGTVRKAIRARYRQWLTHKLASWIDQFGASGCTGCGRCITWCPVGIDLTQEVAAIRGGPTS